jgi:diaminopimelate decarboxylase
VRVTIDSVEEVDVIEKAANELKKTANVRIRLKPVISEFTDSSNFVAEGLVPTDIAAMAYKGGLSYDAVMTVAPRILKMENVNLVGFHQHHGRHHASTRYWEAQMKAFAEEMGKVCKALGGYQPEEIDIGGGFAIPRDPFNAATDYTEPVQLAALHAISKALKVLGKSGRYKVLAKLIDTIVMKPNQTPAPTIEAYAKACTETLMRELPKQGVNTDGLMLQLEPGRAMHGNTGIHLSTVTNIKRMHHPIRWNVVIVDTTEFWFTGGRYEHHLHDYVFANKVNAPMTGKADIIGRSCYGDRLMPTVPIPDVALGDIFAMLDTGAYQEVSMSNFNAMPRPATVLVTGDRAEIVRQAEEEVDVFRRDVIPEHLMAS